VLYNLKGCSVAQKGAAWLRMVQLSSESAAVRQARGSNLSPAPHGGLRWLSNSNEDFPEYLGDSSEGFFYIYIINFTGRISKVPMGRAGGAQRYVCVLRSLERRVCAAYRRACTATSITNLFLQWTIYKLNKYYLMSTLMNYIMLSDFPEKID
jgi:hypothetical protein